MHGHSAKSLFSKAPSLITQNLANLIDLAQRQAASLSLNAHVLAIVVRVAKN